jgi:hypothetical protein
LRRFWCGVVGGQMYATTSSIMYIFGVEICFLCF